MPTDGVLAGVAGLMGKFVLPPLLPRRFPFFRERGERSSGFIRSRSLLCTCIVALIFHRRN